MKSIRFNSVSYDLVSDVSVDSARLIATVFKGANTVDQIAENATGVETIYVYDGEELQAQYSGYETPIAFSLYDINEVPVVCIELENTDVLNKLASLQSQVDTINSSIEVLDGGVSDLGTAVSDINDSQALQDQAIEDLGEAVSELMEE